LLVKDFAVIGLGRFGSSVATTLYNMGHNVLGVDKDESRTNALMRSLSKVVQADATDEETLRALGFRNYDVVVVGIGHDLEASILITMMLKEMGVRHVTAKASNRLHGRLLEKVGADRVVFPERDMGVRVAHHLVAPNVLDYLQLSPDYSILELTVSKPFVGKSLGELDLRSKFGVTVMAIRRKEEINISPGAADVLRAGDIMVVIGHNDSLRRLESVLEG